MIDTTTIRPGNTDSTQQVQTNRNADAQPARGQQFQTAAAGNAGHNGCNLSDEQLQASNNQAEAVDATNNTSNEPTAGMDKASGGNCPGSNVIANLLQELIQALETSRIGR